MRYLRKGVILTKDSLSKHNWQGNLQCGFYHNDETSKHFFCSVISHGLYGQSSKWLVNCLGHIVFKHFWQLVARNYAQVQNTSQVGAFFVIWSLWLYINVYERIYTPLQVIYWCTHILRLWSFLHRMNNNDLFTKVCTRLKCTVRDTSIPMGGCIVHGQALHLLRRYYEFSIYLYRPLFSLLLFFRWLFTFQLCRSECDLL